MDFSDLALLAFILTSVAFLSALTAMRFAIQGREVVMPERGRVRKRDRKRRSNCRAGAWEC
jgi:hypothetical protein